MLPAKVIKRITLILPALLMLWIAMELVILWFLPVPLAGDYAPEPQFPATKNLSVDSQEELAVRLFTAYLESHGDKSIHPKYRLRDYKIEEVRVFESEIKDFTPHPGFAFWVKYSVKPYSFRRSNWLAGNGAINLFWITHKSYFVAVEQAGNTFKIVSMGTGV